MDKNAKLNLEDHLCTKLYIASRLIVQGYTEKLSPLGLTYPQYLVLLALDEHNGQTVGQLGERLSLDSGTLSPLLKSLEAKGFLQRRRLETDERIVANFITPTGRKVCDKARCVAIELFEKTEMTMAQLKQAKAVTTDFIQRCKTLISKKHNNEKEKNMKNSRHVIITLVALLLGQSTFASTYSEVWQEVKKTPYRTLPQYKTTFSSLKSAGQDLIFNSANRTLNDRSDLLPRFQKLVHPAGICFAGTWTIDQPSRYTGYFAEGKQGLIIMRASEAMGNSEYGDWRAFGLAGKIYPTQDASDSRDYQTANFFTVDDLGGTDSKSFLNLGKTNEPAVSVHLNSVLIFPLITRITKAFSKADSHPGIRPLYQISELGMDHPEDAVTPQHMLITSEGNLPRFAPAKDFRNELRLANFSDQTLKFSIFVKGKDEKQWQRMGQILLTDEALTDECDHRLHFSHPKFK